MRSSLVQASCKLFMDACIALDNDKNEMLSSCVVGAPGSQPLLLSWPPEWLPITGQAAAASLDAAKQQAESQSG